MRPGVEKLRHARAVRVIRLPLPVGPASLRPAYAEQLHQLAEALERCRVGARGLAEQRAEIAQLMWRLSRRRAQEEPELSGLGKRAAGHRLLRVGVAQAMRLVEDGQPVGVLGATVPREMTVPRARRP